MDPRDVTAYEWCVVAVIFAIIWVVWRGYYAFPARITGYVPRARRTWQSVRTEPASAMVVLGSGGHTAEMIKIVEALGIHSNRDKYSTVCYLIAATDAHSEKRARAAKVVAPHASIVRIPRAREVGQSWVTTPFTTLRAIAATWWLMLRRNPDLLLVNGPGSCLPLCLWAILLRFLWLSRTKVVYVESVCRVTSLSMTGRILYRLVDRFIVQWPKVQQRYPNSDYIGLLR